MTHTPQSTALGILKWSPVSVLTRLDLILVIVQETVFQYDMAVSPGLEKD